MNQAHRHHLSSYSMQMMFMDVMNLLPLYELPCVHDGLTLLAIFLPHKLCIYNHYAVSYGMQLERESRMMML